VKQQLSRILIGIQPMKINGKGNKLSLAVIIIIEGLTALKKEIACKSMHSLFGVSAFAVDRRANNLLQAHLAICASLMTDGISAGILSHQVSREQDIFSTRNVYGRYKHIDALPPAARLSGGGIVGRPQTGPRRCST
jgi:hypothetical protein